MLPAFAKERQNFGEGFLRREDHRPLQGAADGLGRRMALILIVDDRNPIMGVGKDSPHAVGRLGDP
jgi:hypothetical protein